MPVEDDCILCRLVREEYSSYAMLKLQVSVSRTMSKRAAAMRMERARVGREWRRCSLLSGGESEMEEE